jgi:glycosyltransferase involved in cell wall biosynthesis
MHEIDSAGLSAPACVLDIDVARDLSEVVLDVERFKTCLVRRNGIPSAKRFLDLRSDASVALGDLQNLFVGDASVAAELTQHLTMPPVATTLTVVICTRDRRGGLESTLASLVKQSDPEFDVLVVDNSHDGDVARTLTAFEGLDITCCHEPAPGLSRARNKGLSVVRSELIAWLDDDEVADPDWVAWMKCGFALPHQPAAVAGVMLPAELETAAQVDFERYGGFNKGRGMAPELLVAGTPSVPEPLYPLPNFGAGGNMAFRTSALRAIGGFDNRLGAGTLTRGGEETLAMALLLERGSTIQHWPPAVTWHYHRRSRADLEKQFYGYSAGLTAFYMSLILSSPKYLIRIGGLIGPGLKRIRANRHAGQADGPPRDFPEEVLAAGRRGLLRGAALYLQEARRQRRYESLRSVR